MSDIFFLKNHAENRQEDHFNTSFRFFKKAFFGVKASGQHLNLNINWQSRTRPGHTMKTNCIKF